MTKHSISDKGKIKIYRLNYILIEWIETNKSNPHITYSQTLILNNQFNSALGLFLQLLVVTAGEDLRESFLFNLPCRNFMQLQ